MLLTLASDEEFHDGCAELTASAGLRAAPLRATSLDELEAHLAADRVPDAVVVGPGPEDGTATARRVVELLPNAIVLLVATPTTATLRAALRAGCRDVLAPDFDGADLGEALRSAGYGERRGEGELPGRTIAVFSAKGGVGTSVLASNLAVRLADRTGTDCVLADLDLASADQAVMHGLRARWTMQDVADGSVGDDVDALDQVLLQVPDTSLRLLAGPVDPAAAEGIRDTAVADTLHKLRQLVPLVVADTASAFSDATLAVLDAADVIVLVVSLDVLALRSLAVTLQTFDQLGIDRGRLRVVVMRSDAKVGLTVEDVARTTGIDVDVAVPSSRDVARSINTAVPLAVESPRNAVVRAVDELVDLVVEGGEIAGIDGLAPPRRGLFGLGRSLRRSTDPDPDPEPEVAAADVEVTDVEVTEVAATEVAAATGPDAASPATSEPPQPQSEVPDLVRAVPPQQGRMHNGADDVGARREGAGGDVAPVIRLEEPDRLATLPPPTVDRTPARRDDDSRRGRRSARS